MTVLLYDRKKFVVQCFAAFGENTALNSALKQLAVKLRLKILNTAAQRLLRDKQSLCGFGYAFVFRCFNKILDMLEFHTITSKNSIPQIQFVARLFQRFML